MGYNALPTVPNADPVPGTDIQLELQAATQLSDLRGARDASFTPYARLVVPFRGFAALEVDAVPTEVWRVSPETAARLGATNSQGRTPGDVRFGARFLLWPEEGARPAAGIRFLTKSTTGKGFLDRRFTNAPAYVLDLLLGKDLAGGRPRVRLLAKAGFTAWEQGSNAQDDAVDLGATLQLVGSRFGLDLEWRGYFGYQQGDQPQVFGLAGRCFTGPVDWVLTMNRGVSRDAPPWEARAGFVLHLPTPWQ